MTDLDVSLHSLNNSSSKQKFSFPKTQRFGQSNKKLCDSFYEIPSTKTARGAAFGYGNKDMGIRSNKFVPGSGTYELGSEFKPQQKKGFSFGIGREQMSLGGPLKDSKLQQYIPGPGRYQNKDNQLSHITSTLRKRLPDTSMNHLLKNPGPGEYQPQQIGGKNYYITSKHKNDTNFKISPGSRLSSIAKKSNMDIGPGSYTINVEDINAKGRYSLSNHESSKSRYFNKSPRESLVNRHMLNTPGPLSYKPFTSQFGN